MKTSSAKAKGSRLERDISKALRSAGLDPKAQRMPMSGSIDGFKSDIHTSLPFSIEAKNQETWSPLSYMEQAEASAAHTGKAPVVIMSRNRLPDPFVVMKLSDWIVVLQRAFIENKSPILTGKQVFSKHMQLNRK